MRLTTSTLESVASSTFALSASSPGHARTRWSALIDDAIIHSIVDASVCSSIGSSPFAMIVSRSSTALPATNASSNDGVPRALSAMSVSMQSESLPSSLNRSSWTSCDASASTRPTAGLAFVRSR
eukprot:Amastigsp_a845442_16.p5 type:complete len:125 gc:universal Amastigsp_a845442_16:604-230(-)